MKKIILSLLLLTLSDYGYSAAAACAAETESPKKDVSIRIGSNTHLGREELEELINPDATSVHISRSTFAKEGSEYLLDFLASMPKLNKINFFYSPLSSSVLPDLFKAFPPTLKYFSFSSSGILPSNLNLFIGALKKMTSLEKLELMYNGFGPEAIAQLSDALPSSLKNINLSGNPISTYINTHGVDRLSAALAKLATLHALSMRDCGLSLQDAKKLTLTMSKSDIRVIDFSDNNIAGFPSVAFEPYLYRSLKILDLTGTGVSDTDIDYLLRTPPISLEVLWLSKKDFSEYYILQLQKRFTGLIKWAE